MSIGIVSAIDMTAGLLRSDERDAVLGDLVEAGASPATILWAILGLLARQQAELWRTWRPWLAAGVALPGSLLLLGVSFGLSMSSRTLLHENIVQAEWPLLREALLLFAWAWTCGFVIGCLSRRTLWVSALLCLTPCLSCVLRFREPSISRFCVLVFLLPALLGVLHAIRTVRLQFAHVVVLALAVTGLMLSWIGMSACNWALVLPSWLLVAMARNSGVAMRKDAA